MATTIVVLEIVSLLWSHPILTGIVILMFTTPLFHLVLFFTPLLVSTALCVIALISIGPQIEKIREERQNKISRSSAASAAAAAVERPVNRYLLLRQGRPQRPPGNGGARRWADWVKGIEIHGNTVWLTETHIMRDIAEEGLKADFSHDDGGITMTPEDFDGKRTTTGAFTTEVTTTVNHDEEEDGQAFQEGFIPNESQLQVKLDADPGVYHDGNGIDGSQRDLKRIRVVVPPGRWSDRERSFSDLVPVVEEEPRALKPQGTFVLNPSSTSAWTSAQISGWTSAQVSARTSAALKTKKKKSWFRRRRIPCLSKALGQLRERICSQIRRIFS